MAVERFGVKEGVLVSQTVFGKTDGPHRAGVDRTGDARLPRRFKYVHGALHVGPGDLSGVPGPECVGSSHVEHRLAALHGPVDGLPVQDVAFHGDDSGVLYC